MMLSHGWIGDVEQLYYVLRMFNADKDIDGKFIVRGSITSFMGAGKELCVSGDAEYRVTEGGIVYWRNLASALNSTPYGMGVTVI